MYRVSENICCYLKEVTKDSSSSESEDDETSEPGSTLFVKNLNFDTTQETLTEVKWREC